MANNGVTKELSQVTQKQECAEGGKEADFTKNKAAEKAKKVSQACLNKAAEMSSTKQPRSKVNKKSNEENSKETGEFSMKEMQADVDSMIKDIGETKNKAIEIANQMHSEDLRREVETKIKKMRKIEKKVLRIAKKMAQNTANCEEEHNLKETESSTEQKIKEEADKVENRAEETAKKTRNREAAINLIKKLAPIKAKITERQGNKALELDMMMASENESSESAKKSVATVKLFKQGGKMEHTAVEIAKKMTNEAMNKEAKNIYLKSRQEDIVSQIKKRSETENKVMEIGKMNSHNEVGKLPLPLKETQAKTKEEDAAENETVMLDKKIMTPGTPKKSSGTPKKKVPVRKTPARLAKGGYYMRPAKVENNENVNI